MSKQFIQFASVLFMLAALLAVSAQENTTALNNATMNNTTLLNNTTLNASVIEVPILPTETANETALNETVSAENESAPAASEIIPVQNETAPSQIEVIATQNETAPAQNTTQSENVTVVAEPVSTASLMPAISQPGVMQIGSPQKTAFAIGGIGRTPSLFPIDSKALSQDAYKIGLPAETIMDLSALPFFVNKM
jgi:cytoskeletal protein RodZ